MKIKIAENIRLLRKDKGLTQEALASMLNITSQSVSKWEREEGLPDILILPSLANCLGVSVDALLGNDKQIVEDKINNYIESFVNTSFGDDKVEALRIARKAYNEFSYDFRVIMLYVTALRIYSYDDSAKKIKELCENILENCKDNDIRKEASFYLYGLRDMSDELYFLKSYIKYGQNVDWHKIYGLESKEGKIIFQHDIADSWWHLNQLIYDYGDLYNENTERDISHCYKIKLIEKCQKIFNAFFDENDLGEYTFYLGQYNEFLAREYAALSDKEKTLEHFEKAVFGWQRYNDLPDEYAYKNILINHRPYLKEGVSPYSDTERYKSDVDNDPNFDFVRSDKRFIEIYNKL